MKIFCKTLLLLLWATAALAQADWKSKYDYGLSLLGQGKNEPAQTVLSSLLSQLSPQQPAYDQTLYLLAVAQQRNKQYAAAEQTLKTLLARTPHGQQAQEALYLLAYVQFAQGQSAQGFESLERIQDPKLSGAVARLLAANLSELATPDLQQRYQRNPQDSIVANELWERMAEMGYAARTMPEFPALQARYGKQRPVKSGNDTFQVAALLPFFLDEQGRKGDLALRLYQGMLLAKEQLEQEGVKVELSAYDTDRQPEKLKTLLNDPAMEGFDLLVGPLYTETVPLAKQFSNSTGIPMVNPISNSPEAISGVKDGFLLGATPATLAQSLAREQFTPGKRPAAYILYGNSAREQQLAQEYKKAFEAKGGKVRMFKPYDYAKGYQSVRQQLGQMVRTDSVGLSDDGLHNHLFVALDKEVPALNVLSGLQTEGVRMPVYVPDSWLKFKQLGFKQLEKAGITIVAPDFYDYQGERMAAFNRTYLSRFKTLPNETAIRGFETMYLFGRMMALYGHDFKDKMRLQEQPIPGWLLPAHRYFRSQDNQYVPLVRFRDGQLQYMNQK